MLIHQRDDWPKLRWNSAQLAYPLAKVRFNQGRLLGQMRPLPGTLQGESASKALEMEVGASSELEGKIIGSDVFLPSGAAQIMTDVTTRHSEPLTLARLLDWHSCLATLKPTQSAPINQRTFRVALFDRAPTPDRLPYEIDLFLHWFNKDGCLDPVLKAGIAYFWFLVIQPVAYGNGLIARAILNLRLARSEKTAGRFYSISNQIWVNQKTHDEILTQTLHGDMDITPWLQWFLEMLGGAIENAEYLLAPVLAKARFFETVRDLDLNPRQRAILHHLFDNAAVALTSTNYATLAQTSHDTATRDINDLIQKGVLLPGSAGGRSTSYSPVLIHQSLSDSR